MNTSQQIAKHLREVFFGGNWTSVHLKEHVNDLTWEEATKKIYSLNSIAALVYHINYYVCAIAAVLQGKPLDARDKFSFDHPPVQSREDWENLLSKTWADVEHLSSLVEKLAAEKLEEIFVVEKYGIYYRNLHGLIEHSHYHLGQIVLIKKILKLNEAKAAI